MFTLFNLLVLMGKPSELSRRCGMLQISLDLYVCCAAPKEQTKGQTAGSETWRRQAEYTGTVRILQWAGVGSTTATWPKRYACIHKGTLYLLEDAKAASPTSTTSFWTDRYAIICQRQSQNAILEQIIQMMIRSHWCLSLFLRQMATRRALDACKRFG